MPAENSACLRLGKVYPASGNALPERLPFRAHFLGLLSAAQRAAIAQPQVMSITATKPYV